MVSSEKNDKGDEFMQINATQIREGMVLIVDGELKFAITVQSRFINFFQATPILREPK